MGARGRTANEAKIALIRGANKRPDPPDYLEKEAATEWKTVVDSLPEDWFSPETYALLENRCRIVVWLRRTSLEIEKMLKAGDFDVRDYDRLQKLIMMQSKSLIQYDTKMRLTQQSTYDKSKRKGALKSKKAPWQEAAE